MNSIFNINRFIKYIKTFAATHAKQYMYALMIVGGYTLVGLLLHILVPMFFPAITFSIIYGVIPLSVAVIVLAPCFFEKTISKNNSIFDFILPVSFFEKFLTRLLNYVLVLPILLFGTIFILSQIAALLSADQAEAILAAFDLSSIITFDSLMKIAIFQSFYWVGYFYFKRYSLIKTTMTIIATGIIFIIAVTTMGLIIFGNLEDLNNISVISDKEAITNAIAIPNYIISALFPLGTWLVCMLKIRETEI